ncbi:hypothetical protein Tco_0019479 [Tanacetum coccineum]
MVGANHAAYTDRFHELAKLVTHLVTLESKCIERYIHGLAPQIRGMIRSTQPTTIQSAILKVEALTDEAFRCGTLSKSSEKRNEVVESSKQGGSCTDNKRAKVGKGFVCTNAEESWALLEDLALYENESWNDPRDFAKPVKEISLPQDVPSTSDRRLIELENQVQRLMEAHLAPKQSVQVNKITSSCEIYSGPHDTQYCMENPEQAFFEYASSRIDEARGKWYTFKSEQNNLGYTYNS